MPLSFRICRDKLLTIGWKSKKGKVPKEPDNFILSYKEAKVNVD
jgi:hypothetical protein